MNKYKIKLIPTSELASTLPLLKMLNESISEAVLTLVSLFLASEAR